MKGRGRSLQLVVLAPVLALMIVAGAALYFLVLRTVGDYADMSIRANQDSAAGGAYAIVDAEFDQQTYEGTLGDPRWTLLFKLNARIRFEDFAREQEIGLIVESGGGLDFATGLNGANPEAIRRLAPTVGAARLGLPAGGDFFVRPIAFAPWDWRIILVNDASAFETLVGEVRAIYVGSALLLLLITLLLVIWLRQMLVRPIFRIAGEFGEGRAPDYKGVRELEFLSDSIGGMMGSLQEKTLHLETALESMSDGITVFDPDMNLIAWNPQFIRLYRYPDWFVREGLNFADIMLYNIERGDYGDVDHEAHLAWQVERARNLDPPRFEVDRADGTSIEIRRARMPDGGYVTTYSDITQRRQAEEERLARREADAANRAKSDFLRNMSHDLRKPVLAIAEYVKLVLDKSAGQLAPRLRTNLENAQVSADHLRRMIDEILEMSRIEAGQVEVQPEPVSLEPLIDGTLLALSPVAEAKGLQLAATAEEGLRATIDPRLLSRIVMNLAGNAVEYTDEGEVTVTARRRNEALVIAVTDTGKGIPASQLEAIFEKFQQVEPVAGIVKPGMGLGLGLAISKEFAHLLGGEIAVASEQGRGSTFTLTVPLEYQAAPASSGNQRETGV
jgi:signal transduction histidine kinase